MMEVTLSGKLMNQEGLLELELVQSAKPVLELPEMMHRLAA